MPTRFHLSESTSKPDQFQLRLPFYHNYDILLSEKYAVEVTLPMGATNINVDLPFAEAQISTDGKSYSTLDFMAAPVITIQVENANSLLDHGDLTITYELASTMLLMKPLYMSGIVFAILLVVIISSRVDLSFTDDSDSHHKKQD